MNTTRSCTQQTVSSEVYDEHYYREQDGPGGWRRFLETGGQHRSPREGYLRSLGKLKDGMRVLDIGCGRGEFVLRCVQDHQLVTTVYFHSTWYSVISSYVLAWPGRS